MHETRPLLKNLSNTVSEGISNAFLVVGVLGKSNMLPSQAQTIYPLNLEKPLYLPYNLSIKHSDISINNFELIYIRCFPIA